MEQIVKILAIEQLTHNVKKFIVEKPANYNFVSGQYTTLAINKPLFKNQKKPFTISSSSSDSNLEFSIKIYPEREKFTKELDKLKVGDEIILGDAKGKMKYHGKGVFIAAGTGVVPFISIMKKLGKKEGNLLIYQNKTQKDIILEKELKNLFGRVIFVLTREKVKKYEYGKINKEFISEKIKNFNQYFYICGPALFIHNMKNILKEKGVDNERIISEF